MNHTCGHDLYNDGLGVISAARQTLDTTMGWSGVEEIEEPISYYCPGCGSEIDFALGARLEEEIINIYEGEE